MLSLSGMFRMHHPRKNSCTTILDTLALEFTLCKFTSYKFHEI